MPHSIVLAQPTLVDVPPRGPGWWHELKLDGYRMVASVDGAAVELLTRQERTWTPRAPSLVKALGALGLRGAVIDGEVVLVRPDGRCDFHGLAAGPSARTGALVYVAFDVMFHDGLDVRTRPLLERRALLEQLVGARQGAPSEIQLNAVFEGSGSALLQRCIALGLEGIVSKRTAAPYPRGRTREWLKTKNARYERD